MNDLLSRKEIVEYLRKENYEDEIVGIVDNFPPAIIPTVGIFNLLVERIKYDGDDFGSLTLLEVARGTDGAKFPSVQSQPIVSAKFARCPTCGRTDKAYQDNDWYCLDPWHGDDHLRRSPEHTNGDDK